MTIRSATPLLATALLIGAALATSAPALAPPGLLYIDAAPSLSVAPDIIDSIIQFSGELPQTRGQQPETSPSSDPALPVPPITGSSDRQAAPGLPVQVPGIATTQWSPPPLPVPLAQQPGDHFWFIRPMTSNYINEGLSWYQYGVDGEDNDFYIHLGIDLANPDGTPVHAVGNGTVIWADEGHHNQYESVNAYGNTVVIAHTYGYQGHPLYTLYAHLSSLLVEVEQQVEEGDIIGLSGSTGKVTGPHLHFEVRLGLNSYYRVRNPDLWIAPYSGCGVIAGRAAYPGDSPANDASITITSLSTGEVFYRTTTYAGPGVNPDDYWHENFVIPNVPVGAYTVEAVLDYAYWHGSIMVLEGMVNWVELTFGR
nr:peptidoglycan DD-metalloendopeptidase family protein [Anaerolineae bacterium]